MVGWAGGVATLRSSAVKSLEYDKYVDDDILSYALGMLCAHIPPFQSQTHAAHFHPLAVGEWLNADEDVIRRRASIGQDPELTNALRYVDQILVPMNIRSGHWHLMVIDRQSKMIHYFDPFHLRNPYFKGDPEKAVKNLKSFLEEYTKEDPLSQFTDINDYTFLLAHENESFRDKLPLQLTGCGCAIHCISFAVDMMKGSHFPISDEQTKHLRKVLRALINTSQPFGTSRSHRQEWSARIAARDLFVEMEIDIYSGTLGSPLVPAPAGDGNACKTTTTSFYSTNGKSNEQGEPHESPDQVPQDGMEIEMQNGVNLDQQCESQEMEELDKVDTVQATISRISDETMEEPIIEKGSRKRQSEEGDEPARKAKKKYHSGKARTEKKRAMKAAYKA